LQTPAIAINHEDALADRAEQFCLGSPAALTKVRDTSENGVAVVAAVKAGELLKEGALQAEASAQQRRAGLQIVVIEPSGEQRVAFQPPPPMQTPLLDVTSRLRPTRNDYGGSHHSNLCSITRNQNSMRSP
jgi:hypothetical protein